MFMADINIVEDSATGELHIFGSFLPNETKTEFDQEATIIQLPNKEKPDE